MNEKNEIKNEVKKELLIVKKHYNKELQVYLINISIKNKLADFFRNNCIVMNETKKSYFEYYVTEKNKKREEIERYLMKSDFARLLDMNFENYMLYKILDKNNIEITDDEIKINITFETYINDMFVYADKFINALIDFYKSTRQKTKKNIVVYEEE